MSVTTELSDFGFEATSIIKMSNALGESNFATLRTIFNRLWKGNDPFTDNERVDSIMIRYAIIEAMKHEADEIDQTMLDYAKTKTENLAKILGTMNIQESEMDQESDSVTTSTTSAKKRNPKLYPAILRLVTNNREAEKEEIESMLAEQVPNVDSGTFTNYFYKARRELGIKTTGKRGRKSSGKIEAVRKIMTENPNASRKELVELCEQAGINPSTATVYICKVSKEKGE